MVASGLASARSIKSSGFMPLIRWHGARQYDAMILEPHSPGDDGIDTFKARHSIRILGNFDPIGIFGAVKLKRAKSKHRCRAATGA